MRRKGCDEILQPLGAASVVLVPGKNGVAPDVALERARHRRQGVEAVLSEMNVTDLSGVSAVATQ
ncbi:hypothetical protein D8B22_12460 [Verminephrobacter aporrectodeae subsp. tuberculatae]|nr:hypothetical protein [Verminephrobacter aporrectodeae subsp. tuberculatae]MCW8169900.1 hypothetical protein [Verminephrobacter aporrectodeae subsp. tuberculatae]